ncbi:HlyD family efflux transporter periplasmic adaptor subunit [Candidatus Reidiella endopervernicosa]|uniref:HlyD family efflux transporter periplasmic adaptor subunit n=1 Tax=Candidatus Reidiella endopervernicosa TaxID=2738883 RepID=A0A6N0HXK7_9GAMM|nr:HlyD family efflux transporter periplasmic adaptor subunit [Candidatus Reidiella endopervernicosa]QKQ27105.1 HlyD family efflux transporter periplasmic adaptor subunit [Candidatus Reidiella endopervernicosa]
MAVSDGGQLLFAFDGFQLIVELEMEVIRYDAESCDFGCRFVNLSKQNLSLIHYVINAFLSGELVNAGDLLHVVGRDSFIKKDLDKKLEENVGGFTRFVQGVKRFVGRLVLFSIFAALLWFIGFTAYNRLFVIESLAAKVQGSIVVLRAPDDGFFHQSLKAGSEEINSGQMLGIVKLVNGGAATIEGPCDCLLHDVHVRDDVFVAKGEPLFTLTDKSASMRIEAQVAFEFVDRLKVGDDAEVRLVNGELLTGKVIEVRAHTRSEYLQSAPLSRNRGQASEYATVVIEPSRPIPAEMLDSVATVKISTLDLDSLY